MKKITSWILVLCMALSLVPAGFAEEFFAEEAFVDAPAGDENVFFEEGLFGDAAFFAAENAEEAPAAEEEEISLGEFEARSIVSFSTDQVKDTDIGTKLDVNVKPDSMSDADWEAWVKEWTDNGYWKVKPTTFTVTAGKKSDQLVLTWAQKAEDMGYIATKFDKAGKPGTIGVPTKFPKTVKYYIYAVNNDTGAAFQVGKPVAVKFNKAANTFGNTVTLSKLDGDYSYFVRAESLVAVKATKLNTEDYGLSSDIVNAAAVNANWSKKVSKITVVQYGNEVEIAWAAAYNNLDGYKVQAMINGAAIGSATPDGSSTSCRIALPAGYKDNDLFTATITPVKTVNGTPTDGVAATSGKLKLVANDPWKTLANFDSGEARSNAPMDHAEVYVEWTVAEEALPVTYNITGLTSAATIVIEKDEAGNVKATDTSKKSPFGGDLGSIGAEKVPEGVHVLVIGPVKPNTTAKVTIVPQKEKAKGGKTVANIALKNYFMAQPVITSGAQVDNNTVKITFTQGEALTDGETFIITGFNGKTEMFYSANNNEFYSNVSKGGSDVTIEKKVDAEGNTYFEAIGSVKPVKKTSKVNFAVQAKLGKKSSKKSANYPVDVMPQATAAAMDIKMGGVAPDGTMEISFRSIVPVASIKEINVSLVSADSFSGSPTYSQVKTLVPNGTLTFDANNVAKVKFDGVVKGVTYTVFVETLLQLADGTDGGRTVDKVTSLAEGEVAKDERLAPIDSEKVDALEKALADKAETTGYTVDGKGVYIGEFDVDLSALGITGSDVSWEVKIGNADPQPFTGKISLTDGATPVKFRPVIDGEKGEWTDDVMITGYQPLDGKDIKAPTTLTNIDAKYEVSLTTTGGSNDADISMVIDGKTEQYIGSDDKKTVSVTPEKIAEIVGKELNENDTFKVEIYVLDPNITGPDGNPYSVKVDEITVTVSTKKQDGMFTFQYRSNGSGDYVAVLIEYRAAENTDKTKVRVPAESSGKKIVEIGAGVFKDNTDIKTVELPNQIEVIGESAFSGCTSLANMTCFD